MTLCEVLLKLQERIEGTVIKNVEPHPDHIKFNPNIHPKDVNLYYDFKTRRGPPSRRILRYHSHSTNPLGVTWVDTKHPGEDASAEPSGHYKASDLRISKHALSATPLGSVRSINKTQDIASKVDPNFVSKPFRKPYTKKSTNTPTETI